MPKDARLKDRRSPQFLPDTPKGAPRKNRFPQRPLRGAFGVLDPNASGTLVISINNMMEVNMAYGNSSAFSDYVAAVDAAEHQAFHSVFDIHVLEASDGSYSIYTETDCGALPTSIIDRIVYTATGSDFTIH